MNLRDYQITIRDKALEMLRTHHIAYLAMEVRTGKTLTAIATAYCYGAKKVLFVTKKKAITDIIQQAYQMGYELDIKVINYEQLQNESVIYDFIIADEAHGLGAFPKPAKRATELKRIAKGMPIIFLSGTPTPESYSQLFHQLWCSSFSPFRHYSGFYKWSVDYVRLRKIYIFNRAINDYSDADITKIKPIMEQLMISFTQEEAGFESFVQEEIHYVMMENSTYKFADKMKKDKIAINADGEVVKGDTAVKLMSKLHQIYSGTVIVDEPERIAKVFDERKAEFIHDKFAGQKIAIYYKFIAEYYAILKLFAGRIVDDANKFNEGGNELVFVSQIASGREGVNLSTADALIFYNIDFSAVSYWQSRARIQTKDREKESKIHWIFAHNGIEDKIYKAVMEKKHYTLQHFKRDYGI
jgi:hypothetical protein